MEASLGMVMMVLVAGALCTTTLVPQAKAVGLINISAARFNLTIFEHVDNLPIVGTVGVAAFQNRSVPLTVNVNTTITFQNLETNATASLNLTPSPNTALLLKPLDPLSNIVEVFLGALTGNVLVVLFPNPIIVV